MKRSFCVLISVFLIIIASVFGFLKIQKEKGKEIARKNLDEFYIKELQRYYLLNLKEEMKDKPNYQDLSRRDKSIEMTKEHMSKDGYNWLEIKEMDKEAEGVAECQFWNEEQGYEDGFAGKEKDHERESLLNDPNGQNLHYLIGYDKGKKRASTNKIPQDQKE